MRTLTARPSLVLMCGTSFSGKSTVCRVIAERLGARVVSYDAINDERGLRGGAGLPVSAWQHTHEEAQRRAASLLRPGDVVVVDDTSSPRLLRDQWRSVADAAEAAFVLVYVDAPPALALARAESNRRRPTRPDVATTVLADHLAHFEPPAPDEPHLVVDGRAPDPAAVVAHVRAVSR